LREFYALARDVQVLSVNERPGEQVNHSARKRNGCCRTKMRCVRLSH